MTRDRLKTVGIAPYSQAESADGSSDCRGRVDEPRAQLFNLVGCGGPGRRRGNEARHLEAAGTESRARPPSRHTRGGEGHARTGPAAATRAIACAAAETKAGDIAASTEIGMALECTEPKALMPRVMELAGQIASHPPLTARMVKTLLRQSKARACTTSSTTAPRSRPSATRRTIIRRPSAHCSTSASPTSRATDRQNVPGKHRLARSNLHGACRPWIDNRLFCHGFYVAWNLQGHGDDSYSARRGNTVSTAAAQMIAAPNTMPPERRRS